MNYIDIIILILLVAGLIGGFFKGLVASVASLAGLITGIWAAIKFTPGFSVWLITYIHIKELYINIIAFILIFIVVQIAFSMAGKLLEGIIDGLALGFINKILGAVFGVIKTALILSFLLILLNMFWKDNNLISEKSRSESKLYKYISGFIPAVYPCYQEFSDKIKNTADDYKE